jgi:hypothetical protein
MGSIVFDRNLCLICDTPLGDRDSLFCEACEPDFSIKLVGQDGREITKCRTVGEMKDLEIGYVLPSSVFTVDDFYRIRTDDEVRQEPSDVFSLRIVRNEGLVLVDTDSIGTAIFFPGEAPTALPVELVDFNQYL